MYKQPAGKISDFESTTLVNAPLGKTSSYITNYMPSLLFPIPRQGKRDEIQVPTPLPFTGFDMWNAYELSWLNEKGKPVVAIAQFIFPCQSPNIIESKSFKLYLNSFNNSKFGSYDEVERTLKADLSTKAEAEVNVKVKGLEEFTGHKIEKFEGECMDDIDIEFDTYTVRPDYLAINLGVNEIVEETLFSNLLKSNCLVTGQPDWGSVQIHYVGQKINRENLLRYIVSFRDHNEFHEQCIERIFMDITRICAPIKLTVQAHYTRRGGLDICPKRSSEPLTDFGNIRLARQ